MSTTLQKLTVYLPPHLQGRYEAVKHRINAAEACRIGLVRAIERAEAEEGAGVPAPARVPRPRLRMKGDE